MRWFTIALTAWLLMVGVLPGLASPSRLRITIESESPYFQPAVATATAGTAIRWENPTPVHHTITHDGCISEGPCAFDSGSIAPDETYTVPSLPPGNYSYHCRLHPIMRGVLTVSDAGNVPAQT